MESNQHPLANLDVESAINRIASGELTRVIAAEYGVPKPTLRDHIKKHPKYAEAIVEQAESIVEKATAEMMDDSLAADTAVIARARARVDTAHKWAAARDPAHWSPQRGQVQVNVAVVADERLTERLSGLLDKIAVQQSDNEIQDVS